MKWGVIGALDAEIELIKNSLDDVKEYKHGYFTIYAGLMGAQEVFATVCSVATVNAAICTQYMIDEFKVDAIINTGIAGAMGKGVNTLDVVISRSVCYHDRDKVVADYAPNRLEFEGDAELICRAQAAVKQLGITYRIGKIASGDIFVNDGETKKRINELCSPDCVEMEGAAIAQAAFMNDVPFVVIRTMSDSADDSADETYDNLFGIAAQHSANIVINMIKEG